MIKLSLKKYLFVLFFSGLLLTNPALAESDETKEPALPEFSNSLEGLQNKLDQYDQDRGSTGSGLGLDAIHKDGHQSTVCYFFVVHPSAFYPPVSFPDAQSSGGKKSCVFTRDEDGKITGIEKSITYSGLERKIVEKAYRFSIRSTLRALLKQGIEENEDISYSEQLIEDLSFLNDLDSQPLKLGTIDIKGMVTNDKKALFLAQVPYDIIVDNSGKDSMRKLVVELTSEITHELYEEAWGSFTGRLLRWLGASPF